MVIVLIRKVSIHVPVSLLMVDETNFSSIIPLTGLLCLSQPVLLQTFPPANLS